ncbi:MAG: hypothetical protein MJA30_00890, partial [Cytophagales bacterium]|nr:hypothetical protein [Cytophagales bacterium]
MAPKAPITTTQPSFTSSSHTTSTRASSAAGSGGPIPATIVHHRIVRHHSHNAIPDPLVAYPADSLLHNHDSPVPASSATWQAVPQQQQSLAV